MAQPQLLVHDNKDTVGVVVVEGLKKGADMLCVVTADNSSFKLKAKMDVRISHRVALVGIKKGDTVWNYGHDVGVAKAKIGNLEKIGRECRYIDVLEPAEAPRKGAGLYYMDTSSAAAECITLMAAAGYIVHTFPTGQGNVVGNPILPVIKLTGNPRTARTKSEHIDLDVSGILRRGMTIPQAGDALIDMVVRTANGRLTAAEALGHREFVMTKLYRSA